MLKCHRVTVLDCCIVTELQCYSSIMKSYIVLSKGDHSAGVLVRILIPFDAIQFYLLLTVSGNFLIIPIVKTLILNCQNKESTFSLLPGYGYPAIRPSSAQRRLETNREGG